jgi:hypothetical protein
LGRKAKADFYGMTNENGTATAKALQKKKQKRNTGILRFAQNDDGFIRGI